MKISQERLTHLKQLEAESIHIIREVAAEFENPVMLYSIGKDSGVMLHLAKKAFYPSAPPFPLLHVPVRVARRRPRVRSMRVDARAPFHDSREPRGHRCRAARATRESRARRR
mgnify:CR=1 FL=1